MILLLLKLEDEIEYSIVNYEPRVNLIDVSAIHPNYDNYEFDAVITL